MLLEISEKEKELLLRALKSYKDDNVRNAVAMVKNNTNKDFVDKWQVMADRDNRIIDCLELRVVKSSRISDNDMAREILGRCPIVAIGNTSIN